MEVGGRRLLASLVAVASCAVIPVPGGPSNAASSGKPPALARQNVIVGDRMATMNVRLTKKVSIPLTNRGLDDIIDVQASGRASGFLLEGHDLRHPDGWPLFGYWQTAFCKNRDCKPDARKHTPFGSLMASGAVDDPDEPKLLYLPAGDYTLYVIADRGPVKVGLRLDGLKGTRTFRPRRPEPGGPLTPKTGDFNDDGRFVYSQGNSVEFTKTAALGITAVRIRTDANVSQQVGHCWHENPPPERPLRFAPGCPGGSNILVHNGVIVPFPIDFIYVGYFFFPSEDLEAFGTWYAAQSVVRDADGIAFGIDLGPRNGIGSNDLQNELEVARRIKRVF